MTSSIHRNACRRIAVPLAAAALLTAAGSAGAQSIEDKLRTQLRSTAEQLHQLQDAQAQLQADKTSAEQQRDKALADLKTAQAELAEAKGNSGAQAQAERALSSERAAHAQDRQQLEKVKSANDDLVKAARARDAERTSAQAQLQTLRTQTQTCEAKNAQLYQVGHEILDAYEHVGLGTVLSSREPFAQHARVKYDEIAQQYGDQLYAAKVDVRATSSAAAPASSPGAAP